MLRFTIRDVLWLTVVVGIAVGWAQQFRESERLRSLNELLIKDQDRLQESNRVLVDFYNSLLESMRTVVIRSDQQLQDQHSVPIRTASDVGRVSPPLD